MIIALKHYLNTIEHEEQFKPEEERRPIPSITELAQEVDVSRAHLYKLMNNETTILNLTHADKIIKALHRRGFKMSVADLLEFREDQPAGGQD